MTKVIPWPSAYPQAHHPKPTQGLRGEGTSPLIPLSHRPRKTAFCRNVVFPRVWLQFRCRNVVLWCRQRCSASAADPRSRDPGNQEKSSKKANAKKYPTTWVKMPPRGARELKVGAPGSKKTSKIDPGRHQKRVPKALWYQNPELPPNSIITIL